MKKNLILAIVLLNFLFISCSKTKQNSTQNNNKTKKSQKIKKQIKPKISNKEFCKKFIPPWGDEY